MAGYPTCDACRKQSDAAQIVSVPFSVGDVALSGRLCGTHYDEWLAFIDLTNDRSYADFVMRLRRERYSACWAATAEE